MIKVFAAQSYVGTTIYCAYHNGKNATLCSSKEVSQAKVLDAIAQALGVAVSDFELVALPGVQTKATTKFYARRELGMKDEVFK